MPPKKRQAVPGQRTLSFARDGRLTADGAHQPTLRHMLTGQRQVHQHHGAVAAAPLERVQPAVVAARPAGSAAADEAFPQPRAAGGDDDDTNDSTTAHVVMPLTEVNDQGSQRPVAVASDGSLDAYSSECAARATQPERVEASQRSTTASATKARRLVWPSQPATQIVVTAAPGSLVGTLCVGACEYQCTVGRAGVAAKVGEGDGVTPVGRFSLGRVFFRPDRCGPPATMGMTVGPVSRDDGWCDDPSDSERARPSASRRLCMHVLL